MADLERIHFTDRLPPARNWRSEAAKKQALKFAQNIGKWGKLATYAPDEQNAANQRAWSTPQTDTWLSVGRFETAVRYDADEDRWVVWARCVKRSSDGAVAS